MYVVLIEDRRVQRIVGEQDLRKVTSYTAPATPDELLATRDGCDIIFADRIMSDEWQSARNEYINRNPNAVVIEWSAFEDELTDKESALPRRDKKIIKTHKGELVAEVKRLQSQQPGIRTNSRIVEAVALWLGLAVTR